MFCFVYDCKSACCNLRPDQIYSCNVILHSRQAQAKNAKAEKELAKIRESWLPVGPPDDQETITDEERVMFRRVGLKMKPYLPLGE